MSKIQGDLLRGFCLMILVGIFFIPFIKNWKPNAINETLRGAKLLLQIKKLTLELDEKQGKHAEQDLSTDLQKAADDINFMKDSKLEYYPEEVVYFQILKYSISGSLFFFIITSLVVITTGHGLQTYNDYIAVFSRDLAVCVASGFAATFVPWGSTVSHFIYGFNMPLVIALIIVIIT
ncbi:hypothetical protein WJR50_26100 [Catalinimonas sp. 4WD22]|uniref:hypothetical protein n=1 Tax=Catalinimonas locisalis TaxID=3133978 RepID=UPI003101274C